MTNQHSPTDAELFQRFARLSHTLRDLGSVVQNDHDRLIADGFINPSDVCKNKESFTTRMNTLINDLRELQIDTEKRLEDVYNKYGEGN